MSTDTQNFLLIGATSGIGLALAEALLMKPELAAPFFTNPNFRVIATARSESSAQPLRELAEKANVGDRFAVEYVDCDTQENVEAFAKAFLAKYTTLDFFWYNAGISDNSTPTGPANPNELLDVALFNKILYVNSIAPAHLIALLEPLLTKTYKLRGGELKAKKAEYVAEDTKVRVVITSSLMGSMSAHVGPWIPMYTATKAGANHLMRHYALIWPHLCVECIHPGYVKTKMAPLGTITTQESAEGALKALAEKSSIPTACSKLMWYDGKMTEF